MHPVLQIHELVDLIFANLGSQSLYRLALTCHSLEVSALDKLWYTQDSLAPLIHVMSSVAFERTIGSRHGGLTKLVVEGTPTEFEKQRLKMYASRVHELVSPRGGQKSAFCLKLDDSALRALLNIAVFETTDGHRVHFPAIRVLEWPFTGIDGSFFHLVDHFLGPKMQEIVLRGFLQRDINTDDTMAMLWSSIPTRCPELTEFKMTGFGPFVPPTHDMNAWKSLKTFDCRRSQGMPIEIYTALSKLPRLHCLYFYLIQRKDTPAQNRYSETSDLDVELTFPSLRHLTLISEEIENCIEVLRNNSYPVLATLLVGLDFRSGPDSIHSGSLSLDLLDIIPRRVSYNLRHLLIEGYRYDPPVPNPHSQNSSQMLHVMRSILQAFPNMERFELQDCQFTLDVDRTFLMEIGAAWPRLERLALNPDFSTIWPSSTNLLSLRDILEFSEQFPSLSCLWIRVDANGSQLNVANTTTPGASSSLQQMHLGNSPIDNPDDVVEFLLRGFPKLRYLEAWKYSTPSNGVEEKRYIKQWRMVQKKVNKIKKPPTKAWF